MNTPLNPTAPPSDNFDLAHWKLTLPDASEISPSDLVGFEKQDVFYTDTRTGGMVFRAGNRAGHTSGSKYSRCELREMLKPGGSADAPGNNWTCKRGGQLAARLQVDRVSTSGDADKLGRVVIGQIHGPETEVIRLYYEFKPGDHSGRIYAGLDDLKDKTSYAEIIRGVELGERFSYSIKLVGLRLTVLVVVRQHSQSLSRRIDEGYRDLPLYFKAGVYNQNDTGDESDYASRS